MLVRQVALVPDGIDIDVKKIMRIASALQKQVTRDFGPIWEVKGTVDGFARLEDMPLGYWPVMIVEDVEDASGIHQDDNGQPFSLVEFGDSWSLTASHEVLEMLVDPFGDRLIPGKSPKQDQGRVEFLVEVCDPCQDAQHAYTVNDVLVSDFYTPNFFDPVGRDGLQYSFTGAITKPREVLPGGYVSWHDPVSDHWFQQIFFDSEPEFADLGAQERKEGSLREMIDTLSQRTKRLSHVPRNTPQLTGAIAATALADEASVARADTLRRSVEAVKARTRR